MFAEEHTVSILYSAYGDCTASEKGKFLSDCKASQPAIRYPL